VSFHLSHTDLLRALIRPADTLPPTVWFATFLVSVAVTWSAGTTGDRSIHICVLILFAVAGNAIVAGTTVVGARYFAMFLVSHNHPILPQITPNRTPP
jgi:hypothetical protein